MTHTHTQHRKCESGWSWSRLHAAYWLITVGQMAVHGQIHHSRQVYYYSEVKF